MNALSKILQQQLLPWVEDEVFCFVKAPISSTKGHGDGVKVSRTRLKGRRRAIRAKRLANNVSSVIAHWPQDFLDEVRYPKLACVIGGMTDFQVGEYIVHGNEGTVIFLPPGTPHPGGNAPPHMSEERQKSGESCSILWFTLLGDKVQCWTCHSQATRHQLEINENWTIISRQVGQTFAMFVDECQRPDSSLRVVRALFMAFLTTLQREADAQRYLLPGPIVPEVSGIENPIRNSVEQAQKYIRANLYQPLTIESVARQVFLSRACLAERFREETGQTLGEFLTDCRIAEAKALLRDSDWAVSTIAGFVGFKAASSFHRLFKQEVGVTPIQYRSASQP